MDVDLVAEVFAHWKWIMGHERARMDIKRAQVIRDRLRDGYSAEDLQIAIEGCAASPWHRGENDRHTAYDSITLILRDADHVDRFIAMGEQARRIIDAREQRKADTDKPKAPPTEEEKQRVRELLKSVRLKRVA